MDSQKQVLPMTIESLEGDPSNGEEYLFTVRKEANELPLVFTNLRSEPTSAKRRRVHESPSLDYGEGCGVSVQYLRQHTPFDLNGSPVTPSEIWELVQAMDLQKADDAPESKQAWKEFISKSDPIALDHSSVFHVLKYISQWASQRLTAQLGRWAWAMLLQVPKPASASELGLLRECCRVLNGAQAANEAANFALGFQYVLVHSFGQSDLAE